MPLVLGWVGRGLLRPPLLMLVGLLETLFLSGAFFWVVVVPGFERLGQGGPKVRKTRSNAADVHEAGDVFMYRDSSVAPFLDLRRRIKAVMDVFSGLVLFILLLWVTLSQFGKAGHWRPPLYAH